MTDYHTFESVKKWYKIIFCNLLNHLTKGKTVPKILVCNKTDLNKDRKVPKEEAQALADSYGASYHEVSAKLDLGITEMFEDII